MKKLILALLLCFGPTAAFADWKDTHWGMSVEDVQALYPDAQIATPAQLKEWTTPAHTPKLFAPYTEGEFSYQAIFYFNPASQGLSMVALNLQPGGDSNALRQSLLARYGKSDPKIGANNVMKVIVEDWKDGDDTVTYSFFPNLTPSTSVKYIGPMPAAPR